MTPNRARLSNITRNVLNLHETLGAHTRDVLNVHKALGAQHERIAQLEKQLEAMHAQMQTTTPKRKYTTIQDSSPEDTFAEDAEATAIYCHTDLQEIIEEMFPQVADVLCFISDHELEAEKKRRNATMARSSAATPSTRRSRPTPTSSATWRTECDAGPDLIRNEWSGHGEQFAASPTPAHWVRTLRPGERWRV